MATMGDTVYPTVVFKDASGVATDPTPGSVTFAVYDAQNKQIGTTVTLDEATHRTAEGTYTYPYIVPVLSKDTSLTYEFSGSVTGTPELRRGILPVKFVE